MEKGSDSIEAVATSGAGVRELFEKGLRSGFMSNAGYVPDRYQPRLIANDETSGGNLLSALKELLATCDSFDICVAFITPGGLQPLVEALAEVCKRGARGRLLTSTYQNFNSPTAFRKLLEYTNIESRVYQGNLHAKGYVFDRDDVSTVIVGSSNLTQAALTCNREWNVLFRSLGDGGILQSLKSEFDLLWSDEATTCLTTSWIDGYEEARLANGPRRAASETYRVETRDESPAADAIVPNDMQRHALEALDALHRRGEPRALLVSATGTGKTYLSAFDVAAVAARRILFLVHRRSILERSLESYRKLFGTSHTYGVYEPGMTGPRPSCMFAMCSTIVRHLDEFSPDEFDYIVVDEAHRTGSSSYQRILEYFTPDFCLGMTATPTRTDGYDVFALFNHVIAYQITLQDALAEDMLAPFHYFGIADLSIDDEAVDDPNLFSRLTSDERVRHITDKIESYTVDKKNRRGLVFCNRNDEATELSRRFNELGYRTCALSGASSDAERQDAVRRLEAGELEYIFSVDIFNEGVDIPSLNQIIMLRRTESAIVFVQQLGRGLRKSEGKDFTLVLDFIGNYQTNFLVPVALSGDRTYNKDTLRSIVKEGSSVIPGCSTVSFDRVSEAHIFSAIDGGRFNAVRLLREEYQVLRQMLGRIPTLSEFDSNGSIDPLRLFDRFGSYHAFLSKYEDSYEIEFTSEQESILEFVSRKMGSGKRQEDLLLLLELMGKDAGKAGVSLRELAAGGDLAPWRAAASLLDGTFAKPKGFVPILERDEDLCRRTLQFDDAMEDEEFRRQLRELLEFATRRNQSRYGDTYRGTSLVLNAKYTYEEVCYLLNWEKNQSAQNIGGYMFDKGTRTFPVFINYEKEPDISETTKYEDRFLSERRLVAISKQSRKLTSPEITRLQDWPNSGIRPYLFVRKNKNDKVGGKEFYFLGEIRPTGEFEQIVMPGTTKTAVEIGYELRDPVRHDLYEYLTSNFEVIEQEVADGMA